MNGPLVIAILNTNVLAPPFEPKFNMLKTNRYTCNYNYNHEEPTIRISIKLITENFKYGLESENHVKPTASCISAEVDNNTT